MGDMRVVRVLSEPLKHRSRRLKLPSAKDAIFAELLPMEAVRRVSGNTTLYSVTYRRPKKKATDVSSPLIVTVYQSDMRAKRFHVLLKMKIDVRLMTDVYSHRFGVAVAVDEVAECVYAVYTRDESVLSGRLLLRQVKLTLAAADAGGVRRLQRPGACLRRADLKKRARSQSRSCVYEARLFSTMNSHGNTVSVTFKSAAPCIVVQQLLLDRSALLLYFRVGKGPGGSVTGLLTGGAARLKLQKKRGTMDVQLLPAACDLLICGANGHKFIQRVAKGGPQKAREDSSFTKPYHSTSTNLHLGKVADAAVVGLVDAIRLHSRICHQLVGAEVKAWSILGVHGRWLVFFCRLDDTSGTVVAVRGLGAATQPKVVSVRVAVPMPSAVQQDSPPQSPLLQLFGKWLLVLTSVQRSRHPSSTRPVVLCFSLRSLLPPPTVCANCNVALRRRAKPPFKKKVCKVCRIRSFGQYSRAFGCHFCSAACLRDAWPQHSLLHKTPPLRKWTDDDWMQWQSAKTKP